MDVSAAERDFSPSPGEVLASSTPSPEAATSINIRTRRQSVRSRRSQLLDNHNAQPTTSLTEPRPGPQLQPRPSKMSLFGLFSRPKVEKARGYAEQGLTAPASLNLKHANASKMTFTTRSEHEDVVGELQPRTPSAFSFRTHLSRPPSRATDRAPTPALPSGKGNPFEAPPLFQAYPQSIKQATLQVSTMSAETVLQKSKNRRAGGLPVELLPRGSIEDRGSIETRRTAKTTFRHVAHVSIGHIELPKKILILVASGYLLQYAETGPSNRLPERVLQLGKESAAFVCDLIPGKHHVLQISQAVDQQGVLLATSGSIFSKWSLRNTPAKRMTPNLLLVMHDVTEMDSWMTAIRDEIAILGGGVDSRPETYARPERKGSRDESEEATRSSSRLHRAQLRSNPSKVSLVSTTIDESPDSLAIPTRRIEEDERSEVGTIDEIEEEAARLTEEPISPSNPEKEHDTQSIRSNATSMDQQRLNSLRSSQRISHSTMATTIGSSRTNSLCGSPPSEDTINGGSESSTESNEPKSPYRSLSSYASAVARRRTAMPLTSKKELKLPLPNLAAQINPQPSLNAGTDSPTTGHMSPLPKSVSPRKLAVAASEPDLRAAAAKAKHDSHMPAPPTLFEETERPQSIVGELPSPLALTSERMPTRRMSSLMQSRSYRRQSQQSFSLPLKINPSTPQNRPPTRQENRGSFNTVEEGKGEPLVHTLTAKIDLARSPQPSRTPSGRLSLFPSQVSSPPMHSPALPDPTQQVPSNATASHNQPQQSRSGPMQRPSSMQVRSDPALFLRGLRIRTSTHGPPPANTAAATQNTRSFAAPPIRSLKPSRSTSTLLSTAIKPLPSPQPSASSPTDPFLPQSQPFAQQGADSTGFAAGIGLGDSRRGTGAAGAAAECAVAYFAAGVAVGGGFGGIGGGVGEVAGGVEDGVEDGFEGGVQGGESDDGDVGADWGGCGVGDKGVMDVASLGVSGFGGGIYEWLTLNGRFGKGIGIVDVEGPYMIPICVT
ncbi:hypothetical protein LTR03_001132 [Friedmanniomyces endolithicus]|nr:hypothetical protein LTR03_001132 [Friedmanniomyces endolithicus]